MIDICLNNLFRHHLNDFSWNLSEFDNLNEDKYALKPADRLFEVLMIFASLRINLKA